MVVHAVILAAGKGERMRTNVPKPLIPICGIPMVVRLLTELKKMNEIGSITLVIPTACFYNVDIKREIKRMLPTLPIEFVCQDMEQDGRGTGGAFCAFLKKGNYVPAHDFLVLNSDTPFVTKETIVRMMELKKEDKDLVIGTAVLTDPKGYGRIFFDSVGRIEIVEDNELNGRESRLVNGGIYLGSFQVMSKALEIIPCETTGEKKLTDIVQFSQHAELYPKMTEFEVLNINTPVDKIYAEYILS